MNNSVASKQDSKGDSSRDQIEAPVSTYNIPGEAAVTSLSVTDTLIVVGMDDGRLHMFSANGEYLTCLRGHTKGVWATDLSQNILISGGVDCHVRVWDMVSRTSVHVLAGHTATVRCLKLANSATAISGSRDTNLRVWNVDTGICIHILEGHRAMIRCLDISGGFVASGSDDPTSKLWSLSDGKCLGTLTGHSDPIYTIAYDGTRIVTGGVDTTARVWDTVSGSCIGVLKGHTSMVSHIQLRGDMLVTGGADGLVRVWSLEQMTLKYSLAAHENSVTDLNIHKGRIVSGGSDGRVKIWSMSNGELIRESGDQAVAVWKVAFGKGGSIVAATQESSSAVFKLYPSSGS